MALALEHIQDLALYPFFLCGQLLYLLHKSNDSVVIHKTYARRLDYFSANWITALIRFVIETATFYWGWRHINLDTLLSYFHVANVFGTAANQFYQSPFTPILLGLFADTLLLSLTHWSRIPQSWRDQISEQIPELPLLAKQP